MPRPALPKFRPLRRLPARVPRALALALATLASGLSGDLPAADMAALAAGPQVRWIRELIPRAVDPLSGAKIAQLTSAAAISHDIYGEQLNCSADGGRIAFMRCYSTDYVRGPMEVWVCDLANERVSRLGTAAMFLVGGDPSRDAVYYVRLDPDRKQTVVRANLKTLVQTDLFAFGRCPPPEYGGLLAISPDERHCLILRRLSDRGYGIERIDLVKGNWEIIHERDDIFNAHLQFDPGSGDFMVQWNRGGRVDYAFNVITNVGPEGATMYVLDRDGKNERPLPIGTPHTAPVTGHETWLGRTGRLLLTVQGGKILTAAPGDAKPALIAEGPGFNHITASADGRFFVVDNFNTGRLFLGCVATRQVVPFCDTNASGGTPQYTHTHPFITPGNRHVIYNSDRTGICQVYSALIPPGLLEKLATPVAAK